MELLRKVDLDFFINRTSIKSLINNHKVKAIGLFNDRNNFNSHLDFYSDYIYNLYVDNKNIIDVYGSPVIIVSSIQPQRNRVMVNTSGFQGERGSFNRIRKLQAKPISKKYDNGIENYEFEPVSDMIGYKLKSLVNFQNFNKDMTKIGNFFDSDVKFTFSVLDLVEKEIKVEVEKDFIVFNNLRYKINSIIPERYFNNEIFSISFECSFEKPKAG